jgi:hypothetical protein
VQRRRQLAVEAGERVAVVDAQVLEVDLDAGVAVAATQLDEAVHGASARGVVRQEAVQHLLVEAGVHHQRHDGHVVLPGEPQHARVDVAPDDAILVHRVAAGRDERDLRRCCAQALPRSLGVRVVEESLDGSALHGDPAHAPPRECNVR